MQHKQFDNKFIVRLEKGEEIVSSLLKFCEEQNIQAGTVSGIGAANKVELKFFYPENKDYKLDSFEENFEIASLSGTVSTLENKPYLHLHVVLGKDDYSCIGGHLNSAIVSATFEAVIEKFDGKLERKFSEEIGLNLFEF
jgi:predicted DNA-binding protein with PD1-like motif